jgi:hypothetical protein
MLGYVYGHSKLCAQYLLILMRYRSPTDQRLSSNQELGIKVAAPVGNVFGQVPFGWLADKVGRKRMCKPLVYTSWSTTETAKIAP